jgi:hypothetical protein
VHCRGEVEEFGAGKTFVEIELLGKYADSLLYLGRVLPRVERADSYRAGRGAKETID